MATQVKLRRGDTSENDSFTGAVAELSVDTELDELRLHDGVNAGGHRVTTEDIDIRKLLVGVTSTDPVAVSAILNAAANRARTENRALVGTFDTISVQGIINFNGIALNVAGDLDYAGRSGHVVLGSSSASPTNPRQYLKAVTATGRNIDSYCVSIEGSRNQEVTLNFAPSARIYADNADNPTNTSVAYSTFFLGDILHLDIYGGDQGSSAQAGWINENVFFARSLNNLRIGRDTADSYGHNNNRFYGGTFESSTAKISMLNGFSNIWNDTRFENATNDSIVFSARTSYNRVYVTYASSDSARPLPANRYIDNGFGNEVTGEGEAAYENFPLCDLNSKTVILDSDNRINVNISGILNYGVAQQPAAVPTQPLISYGTGNKLAVSQGFDVIYRQDFIKIDQSSGTWLTAQMTGSTTQGAGFRLVIWGWDEDLNPITPAAGDVEIIGQGPVPFGGSNSVNVQSTRIRIARAGVSYISVIVRNGSGTNTFSSMKVAVRLPKARATKTIGGSTYSDEPCNFTTVGNPPTNNLLVPKFFSPLLTSASVGADATNKQSFSVSGVFNEVISAGNWYAGISPAIGTSASPDGLIFSVYLTQDDTVEVWTQNTTSSVIAMPSGMRPVITLTKLGTVHSP